MVQGNGTQTSDLIVFENSSGTNLLSLSNSGALTIGNGATSYTLPIADGAGDNYVLTTNGAGAVAWESIGGAGGMANFTLSGDSGTDQTVSDGNILEIAGGVNGIDSVVGATDTITLNIDTTEIGENTFGNNSDPSIVWTFDQSGATDPTLAFSSDLVTVGNNLTVTGTTTTNGVLTANNTVTLGDGGDSVAINSSDWDINTSGDATGIGNITIDGRFETAAHASNNGLNLPTSAGAPSAVTGTAEGDIVYDTSSDSLYIYDGATFTQIGGGGYSGWTIDGDDADTQSIASGNTLLISGGTNGIDTDVSATDTITINFDTTEVGTTTFGSGSAVVWTFDASAGTDTTLTFGDNLITVGQGLTITGTATTNGVLDSNGQVDLGDNGDTVAIDSSDWDINTTGDATGIGAITSDGAISFTPSSTNDITFNVDTDTLLTLDSSVANADNLVISPNNAGTGATFTGTLTSANLTADRTWTLQDADGTIAFTSDIPTSDNYQYWTISDGTLTTNVTSTATATLTGGTGVDTSNSSGNVTFTFDSTEVNDLTFGDNSDASIVWTFDQSTGTDPTLTFSNGLIAISEDLSVSGGDITGTNSETIDIGETDNGSFIFSAVGETNNESYKNPKSHRWSMDRMLFSRVQFQ